MKITIKKLRKLIKEAVVATIDKTVRDNVAEQIAAQAQTSFDVDISPNDELVQNALNIIMRPGEGWYDPSDTSKMSKAIKRARSMAVLHLLLINKI